MQRVAFVMRVKEGQQEESIYALTDRAVYTILPKRLIC